MIAPYKIKCSKGSTIFTTGFLLLFMVQGSQLTILISLPSANPHHIINDPWKNEPKYESVIKSERITALLSFELFKPIKSQDSLCQVITLSSFTTTVFRSPAESLGSKYSCPIVPVLAKIQALETCSKNQNKQLLCPINS